MPNTDRKLRVFLCHASQDKLVVRELYNRLLTEGWIDPWLDKEKLLPGQDWELEIEKSVEGTDAVIVTLSNEAVTKEGYFQKELKKVIEVAGEKPEGVIFIIPLRLDDCPIPRNLRKWQYIDYFLKDNKERAYGRILESLKIRSGVLGLIVDKITPQKEVSLQIDVEKEILFHLETEPKIFLDWVYQNYFYKDWPEEKRKNMPLKASEYFYKPIGPYNDNDLITITMITERLISGKVFKGTLFIEIESISVHPNPRISVTMRFEDGNFFLVFYRALVGIAKVFPESRLLIMPYLAKYKNAYESVNPENTSSNP